MKNKEILSFLDQLYRVGRNNRKDFFLQSFPRAKDFCDFLEAGKGIFFSSVVLSTYHLTELYTLFLQCYPGIILNLPLNQFLWTYLVHDTSELNSDVANSLIQRWYQILPTCSNFPVEKIDIEETLFINMRDKFLDVIDHLLRMNVKVRIQLQTFKPYLTTLKDEVCKILSSSNFLLNMFNFIVENNTAQIEKFYTSLPVEYQNFLLQKIVKKECEDGEYLLAFAPTEFLLENADIIVDILHTKQYEKLTLQLLNRLRGTEFVLKYVKVASRHYEYLTEQQLDQYLAQYFNTDSPRSDYVRLLENPYIVKHPKIYAKCIKSFSELSKPSVNPNNLPIPDNILITLSPKTIKNLITKCIDEFGNFKYFTFNAELAYQQILSLLFADCFNDRDFIAKITSAINKQKTGKSCVEIICEYLEIPVLSVDKRRSLQQTSDKTSFNEKCFLAAFEKSRSLPEEYCKLLLQFAFDYCTLRTIEDLELKYQKLAEYLSAKHK